jgi:glycosyltransferase involved in cell wall biosynthesis
VRNVCLIGFTAGGHSGVPRYAALLAGALDEVAAEFPSLHLKLLTSPEGAAKARANHIEIELARGPLATASAGPRRIVADQIFAATASAHLLHFFDLTGPLLAPRRPFVTTMHDAVVTRGLATPRDAYKRRLHPWAVRRARAVVATSAFTRQEAVRRLGARPERVRVIHSGPGLPAAPGERWQPEKPYLLYVGTFGQNKNLPFLIRAHDQSGVNMQLLLVGRRRGRNDALQTAIATAAAGERLRVIEDADDRELDRLYRGATALLLPSVYEGFGFPPLEAMARGCPVLASDIPALREVCGPGALLAPPENELAWIDAIRRVSSDGRLRSELRERGARTVARFSWVDTARSLCGLLESVRI